ncbi:hypothetical protein [Lihuaxuella thermophila]|uniref:Uncharacterized protein n=1 Tax=Lihuaxuella thermophila TaxID=1173111 RepID=A0A1H8DX45_9BACL|nr:hypothetical protein [Lihuaxuella thermophila]SEN11735.1 hypothetical protein SAMN05444955_10618 [Lihuaxuella thermophila]
MPEISKIERELRDMIMKGPQHSLTSLTAFCACCLEFRHRKDVRLVKMAGDELSVCLGCINKRGLTESGSTEALEYQERTLAILKIRGLRE